MGGEEVALGGVETVEGGEEGDCYGGEVHYVVGDCWGDGEEFCFADG